MSSQPITTSIFKLLPSAFPCTPSGKKKLLSYLSLSIHNHTSLNKKKWGNLFYGFGKHYGETLIWGSPRPDIPTFNYEKMAFRPDADLSRLSSMFGHVIFLCEHSLTQTCVKLHRNYSRK